MFVLVMKFLQVRALFVSKHRNIKGLASVGSIFPSIESKTVLYVISVSELSTRHRGVESSRLKIEQSSSKEHLFS